MEGGGDGVEGSERRGILRGGGVVKEFFEGYRWRGYFV